MQTLKGKLLQTDLIIPKPDKISGQIKGETHVALSVIATFSKFGRNVPDVVTVKVPPEDKEKYDKKIGQEIEISVYFPTPQYSLQSA